MLTRTGPTSASAPPMLVVNFVKLTSTRAYRRHVLTVLVTTFLVPSLAAVIQVSLGASAVKILMSAHLHRVGTTVPVSTRWGSTHVSVQMELPAPCARLT